MTALVFFGSEDGTVPPKQQLFVNGVLKKEQTLCTVKPDGKTCLTTESILLALEGTSVSYTKLPVDQISGPPTLGRSSTGPNNAFQVLRWCQCVDRLTLPSNDGRICRGCCTSSSCTTAASLSPSGSLWRRTLSTSTTSEWSVRRAGLRSFQPP